MQKKIIALAVAGLMSGAAFAQSNVTISGILDVGVAKSKGENLSSSNNAAYNNTATSQLTISAREDLGGGMRAGVLVETDLRGQNVGNGNLGSFQRYVFLGKAGIGDLSLGQRTNMFTTAAVTVQPFGTAMGGGFGGGFNRNMGGGFEALGAWTATGRDVRPDGAVHFRSDNFNGVSFGLDFKPKNSGLTETAASSGYLGLGVNYNNGPLNLTFANSKATNTNANIAAVTGTNTVCLNAAGTAIVNVANGGACAAGDMLISAGVAPVAAAAGFDGSVKNTMVGGNYTFGAATVYAGWGRSKADTTAAAALDEDSTNWNIGLKYTMGNLAFLFNTLKDNDKTVGNNDRKLTGLGVDYSLSKRTAAYVRYQTFDMDTRNAGGKTTTTAVGLRHSF